MVKIIPLSKPSIIQKDIDQVIEVLNTGMLIQGKYVQSFEDKMSYYTKSNHSIAVSNGTATMHIILKALGISKGDEVIVPAFSYVATANVVELVGATPVFVDIDLETFNIDVNKIEEKITEKTRAIIPVHEFGLACDIEKVCEIGCKHDLFIIEDAACALGARQNGKHVGTFGIAGSFSFHPRKSITSGEGGIICTKDQGIANVCRQLRNHGIDPENSTILDFVNAGFNYRLTDIQAALVDSQMERLDNILIAKSKLSKIYFKEVKNPKVKLPTTPIDRNHTWQTFHVLLDDTLSQKEAISYFKSKGIGVNYGAQCIPSQTYYKNKYRLNPESFYPNAYKAFTKGIALPLFDTLQEEDVIYISKKINELC